MGGRRDVGVNNLWVVGVMWGEQPVGGSFINSLRDSRSNVPLLSSPAQWQRSFVNQTASTRPWTDRFSSTNFCMCNDFMVRGDLIECA